MTQCQKSRQGRRFVNALKRGRKNHTFLSVVKFFIRKTRRKSSIFSFKTGGHEMLFLALQTLKLGGHSCVLRKGQYFRSVSIE